MKTYYYPLDVLRFGAALSVMLFHLAFYSWASDYSTTAHAFAHAARFEFLAPWTSFGWIGVEIFFVISGFVIANSANGATPMAFAQGRIARLYPAALACALVSAFALVLIVGEPISHLMLPFLRSVLLVPKGPWIDGVYWTLAIEIVFYGVIFCVLVLGKFSSIRLLAWGLTLWSGAFLIAVFVFLRAPDAEPYWWSNIRLVQNVLLLRHGCFFAVGIWLWSASRSMSPSGAMGLLLAVATSCAEIYLRVQQNVAEGMASSGASAAPPLALWLGSVALIFWSSKDLGRWTPRSDRVRQGLRRIGAMTYPLYLVHNVAGAALCRLLISQGLNPLVSLFVAISGMIALSYVICTLWEPRVRRQLRPALQELEDGIRNHVKQLAFLFVPGGVIR